MAIQAQNQSKQQLIDRIVHDIIDNPTKDMTKDFDELVKLQFTNSDYDNLLQRIEDNGNLKNESSAKRGVLGYLNKKIHRKRLKRFYKKMKKGFRDIDDTDKKKTILAEGDSWFMYPVFIRDIIDNLNKEKNFSIYSLAFGGDWLSNIISEDTYYSEYKKISPDVLLLSGGGNDIAGNNNVATFLNAIDIVEDSTKQEQRQCYSRAAALKSLANDPEFKLEPHVASSIQMTLQASLANTYQEAMCSIFLQDLEKNLSISKNEKYQQYYQLHFDASKYVNKRFTQFLKLVELQYIILIEKVKKANPEKFEDMHIILQGYDYPIPSDKKGTGLVQILTNIFMGNGNWLLRPMTLKGILDKDQQKRIMQILIFQYYETLEKIVHRYPENVSIIDSRNLIKRPKDWYNELHPKAAGFAQIAAAYKTVINGSMRGIRYIVESGNFIKIKPQEAITQHSDIHDH